MKELSIEEKAKRYDEALHKAKNYYSTTDSSSDIKLIGIIFPELKESDDEKIRKALVEMVHDTTGDSLWIDYNVHKEDALAWLEKQGEQKHAEWSEEDDRMYNIIVSFIPQHLTAESYTACINWFKSLKDRVQPQPKQEWSEKDRRMLIGLIDELDVIMNKATSNEISVYSKYINWLKSLRPQSTWKPSNEQIKALNRAMYHVEDDVATQIAKLIGDLKKLREK